MTFSQVSAICELKTKYDEAIASYVEPSIPSSLTSQTALFWTKWMVSDKKIPLQVQSYLAKLSGMYLEIVQDFSKNRLPEVVVDDTE